MGAGCGLSEEIGRVVPQTREQESMATIPPDEIQMAKDMLRRRMQKEGLSLDEAYEQEVAEHNNKITFHLAKQAIAQEARSN